MEIWYFIGEVECWNQEFWGFMTSIVRLKLETKCWVKTWEIHIRKTIKVKLVYLIEERWANIREVNENIGCKIVRIVGYVSKELFVMMG